MLVIFLWNHVLAERIGNAAHISFLEGAGLTAFAYVIAFSVRYSAKTSQGGPSLLSDRTSDSNHHNTSTGADYPHTAPELQTEFHDAVTHAASTHIATAHAAKVSAQQRCDQMTLEQKEALKRELIAQCGCKSKPNS
ncbi:MAG: hypothetical protein HQ472_05515 [Ignavibacteria bacterium]|nr:hypothetical protein [Ignavibacteria bacterium]